MFLDWDRTLCTSKAGAAPLAGRHVADEALIALARRHPRVVVVTRNRHVSEIRSFLAGEGVTHATVRSVAMEGK